MRVSALVHETAQHFGLLGSGNCLSDLRLHDPKSLSENTIIRSSESMALQMGLDLRYNLVSTESLDVATCA